MPEVKKYTPVFRPRCRVTAKEFLELVDFPYTQLPNIVHFLLGVDSRDVVGRAGGHDYYHALVDAMIADAPEILTDVSYELIGTFALHKDKQVAVVLVSADATLLLREMHKREQEKLRAQDSPVRRIAAVKTPSEILRHLLSCSTPGLVEFIRGNSGVFKTQAAVKSAYRKRDQLLQAAFDLIIQTKEENQC